MEPFPVTVFNAAPGGGSSASQLFVVTKLDQAITFAALPDKTLGSPNFAVTATASSNLSVSFSASGSCTVSGSTVRVTAAGSCSITARQGGNTSYNTAPRSHGR